MTYTTLQRTINFVVAVVILVSRTSLIKHYGNGEPSIVLGTIYLVELGDRQIEITSPRSVSVQTFVETNLTNVLLFHTEEVPRRRAQVPVPESKPLD